VGRISVAQGAGTITISTTSCPGYDWSTQTTPNTPVETCQTLTYKYPPVLKTSKLSIGAYLDNAKTTANPTMVGGQIGVSVNGIAIYSNADANDRDAYVYEGASFDVCGGHPSPDGRYHYHATPKAGCNIYTNTPGQHSPLFAVMMDGFGLYGPYADNGVLPTNLDECGGHVDSSHPFYHYHLPVNYTYPYTVNCLRGCIDSRSYHGMAVDTTCTAASGQNYSYTPFLSELQSYNYASYQCTSDANILTAPYAAIVMAIAMMVMTFMRT